MAKKYEQLTKEVLKKDEWLLRALVSLYEANKLTCSRRGDGSFLRPLSVKRPLPEDLFRYGIAVQGGCLILPDILPKDILAAQGELAWAELEKNRQENRKKEQEIKKRDEEMKQALARVMAGKEFMPATNDKNTGRVTVGGQEIDFICGQGWEIKSLGGLEDDEGHNLFIFPSKTPFEEWLPVVARRLNVPEAMVQATLDGETPQLVLGQKISEAKLRSSNIALKTSGGRYDAKDREITSLYLVAELSFWAEVREAEFQIADLAFSGQVVGNRFFGWKEFAEDSTVGHNELKQKMAEQKEKILENPILVHEVAWRPHKPKGLQKIWEVLQNTAINEGYKNTNASRSYV